MKVLEGIDKLKSTLKAKLEIVKNKINWVNTSETILKKNNKIEYEKAPQ
jgi:predicted translin family RNA/ssDNA-binding protein